MKQVTIRGPQGRLSVSESGQGHALPVLFLHADSGRAAQWGDVARGIARDRLAVAFDFRGSGESDPAANGDYTFAGRASDLASVADAVGLTRFAIVAHSGGSAVALEYAVAHPERVAGLFLVDPPTDPRALPSEVRDSFVRDLAGARSLDVQKQYYRSIVGSEAAVSERVLADCEMVAPAARAGFGAALASWNPVPVLNAWRGPIFVLTTPANDNQHAIYRLREGVPHEVIPSPSHWLQLAEPVRVETCIRRFLQQLE